MAEVDVSNEMQSREVEEEAGKTGADEEDTGAQIAPIVKLEEVAITTGEENEDVLFHMKCKLYRFDKDGNQWKERGVGTVKLLKHKETGKVRLVMRQAKTLKICANHLVLPSISIQEHAGNEKSCVWHATDFSDGELKKELFCIRFGTLEIAKKFMEMVEEIAEYQARKSEEEDEAAIALKGLKIGDQNDNSKEVKEQFKENVKEEDLEGEKQETKGEEKEVENSEVIGEEKEVEKLDVRGEEKEVEKAETKPEAKVKEHVEPK
ncbi:hypothetical protein SUGI_1162840 [Cryptomeria japonica]|uniref:ran-binding protein 1 homolog c n=1 Tax=Cryptomeria japonica TaxID=3369 RepID=UPI002414A8FD|nr:ran-binding protein 1 homolog c [Cryptomeria japonica]GLJ54224.1 hypothetical protein SUGI_1162840 [Cryptomeria japonica]